MEILEKLSPKNGEIERGRGLEMSFRLSQSAEGHERMWRGPRKRGDPEKWVQEEGSCACSGATGMHNCTSAA